MDDKGFDGMNVMPLVDVMLVLLTIVLTTSSFIATGQIPVSLPKAEQSAQKDIRETTKIEIDAQGNLFLQGQPQSLAELKAHLVAQNRAVPVLIRADQALSLNRFVEVLDVVKGLQFQSVHLQTEGP